MSKTKRQRISAQQVKQFLADAQKRAAAGRKNLTIDAEMAYEIAYEAMVKGSLALMLSHGQRPRKQLGHHIAIIEFARQHLGGCPTTTFILFDRMRRKRNDAVYDVTIISAYSGDVNAGFQRDVNSCSGDENKVGASYAGIAIMPEAFPNNQGAGKIY